MNAYKSFERQFIEKTPRSGEMYQEARKYLAGGVGGGGRFMKPYPLYVKDAAGARVTDVDGNEYLDLRSGGGPLMLGHSPRVVVEAVKAQLEHGTNTFLTSELAISLARKICRHLPGAELVRFCNSGSEAGHLALRIALAYTGKPRFAKFEGNFLGQFGDELISSTVFLGQENSPQAIPDSAGIPPSFYRDMVVLPFNNIEASVSLIEKYAGELACVIMEPVSHYTLAGVAAEKPFMMAVREATRKEGILLVWDEVISAFRYGLGGMSNYYGVVPDIRSLGKVIGGGFPVGACCGRREIMEKAVAPTGLPSDKKEKAFLSGTFSGNEITMAAGLATVSELETANPYPYLNALGERLRNAWNRQAADLGIAVRVTGVQSSAGLHFVDRPVKNIRDLANADPVKRDAFRIGMLAHGIIMSRHHVLLNAALSEGDIDRAIEVSSLVFSEIKRSG